MFEKTPPPGIFPSRLLNERFKVLKEMKVARNMGMVPERLLEERSNHWRVLSSLNDTGIESSNELCDRFREVSILSFPNDSGMLPTKRLKRGQIYTLVLAHPHHSVVDRKRNY